MKRKFSRTYLLARKINFDFSTSHESPRNENSWHLSETLTLDFNLINFDRDLRNPIYLFIKFAFKFSVISLTHNFNLSYRKFVATFVANA